MTGAVLLLALTWPLLAVGAAAVLIGSGRPVFFGHERVGRDGRRFRCWKLRTMERGAERRLEHDPALRRRYVQNGFKLGDTDDPRVTRVGQWLRRCYLDELPQLFNVLAGSMSLVGPRPVVAAELDCYGAGAAELIRHRPGIVGAWTALGPARPGYPERARIEMRYLRSRSLAGDIGLLLRSVFVVLRGHPDT